MYNMTTLTKMNMACCSQSISETRMEKVRSCPCMRIKRYHET